MPNSNYIQNGTPKKGIISRLRSWWKDFSTIEVNVDNWWETYDWEASDDLEFGDPQSINSNEKNHEQRKRQNDKEVVESNQ